jgi:hypothetical protein
VNRIVRYFSQFQRSKTMTVLGAKRVTEAEMRLLPLVAKRMNPNWRVVAVMEHAASGPHVHAGVIDTTTSVPQALPLVAATTYIDRLNTAIALMRSTHSGQLTSRWFRSYERRVLDYEDDVAEVVYHVKNVQVNGRNVQAGVAQYGPLYMFKSLVQADQRQNFVCETGVGGLYQWVRSHEEVDIENLPVLSGTVKPFNLETMSFVAYAVVHQLETRKPDEVVVYTKNGHVIREHSKHPLKFSTNELLQVGIEVLWRELKVQQLGAGVGQLKKAVNVVRNTYCSALSRLSNDALSEHASIVVQKLRKRK